MGLTELLTLVRIKNTFQRRVGYFSRSSIHGTKSRSKSPHVAYAKGSRALLLCPLDGSDNLAFQTEKNTGNTRSQQRRVNSTDGELKTVC
jgi:hypothetical protein